MRAVAGKGMGKSSEPGWAGRQSGYLREGESQQ